MKIRVRLFAIARELAGTGMAEVALAEGATIAQLRSAIAEGYPKLAGILNSVVFAVNGEYADDRTALAESDEVACIPPVSGG